MLHGAVLPLADYFARPYLASGRLVNVPLGYAGPRIDVHVFLPQRDQVPRRTRLLRDFLYDGLKTALDGRGSPASGGRGLTVPAVQHGCTCWAMPGQQAWSPVLSCSSSR